MTERPDPALSWPEIPEGCEVVALPDPAWRLVTGKKCRAGCGYHRKACGEPSVAELNRGYHFSGHSRRQENWWAYCPDHLYGRWIEDGKVWHWILREVPDGD